MAENRLTVAQTLDILIERRPALKDALRAFEDVLSARAELARTLSTSAESLQGPQLPEWSMERARQGQSLLAGHGLTGMAAAMRVAAETLLPLLCAKGEVASHEAGLKAFFLAEVPGAAGSPAGKADRRDALAEAMVAGDAPAFQALAKEAGLPPEVLEFVAEFILSPVLRALVLRLGDEPAWLQDSSWQQGYCPVCSSFPTIGWMDKPVFDEKNAYLAGGGGKKYLHCSLCGADWKFRRGACPACGRDGNGTMELLQETGKAYGERLDWCTKCKSYCPTVDLRSNGGIVPDLDAMALGMLYLDMVAARKGLSPLRASFWNLF